MFYFAIQRDPGLSEKYIKFCFLKHFTIKILTAFMLTKIILQSFKTCPTKILSLRIHTFEYEFLLVMLGVNLRYLPKTFIFGGSLIVVIETSLLSRMLLNWMLGSNLELERGRMYIFPSCCSKPLKSLYRSWNKLTCNF